MNITASLVDTCIQYGVLGVLGYVAIRNFVKQSSITTNFNQKMFDYITNEKKCDTDKVLESLTDVIKTLNINNENMTTVKYEVLTELQNIKTLVMDINVDNNEEQIDRIIVTIKDLQTTLIKVDDIK